MIRMIIKRWQGFLCAIIVFLCCFFATTIYTQADGNYKVTTPVLVGAEPVNASSIRVSWQSNNEETGFYVIYRKSETSDYQIQSIILAKNKTSYSYLDTTVMNGITYTYTVSYIPSGSFEQIGQESRASYSSTGEFISEIKIDSDVDEYAFLYLVCTEDDVVRSYTEKPDKITLNYYWDYEDSDNAPEFAAYALYNEGWSDCDPVGVSAKTTLSQTSITNTKLVATGKIRINWKQSKGATGYIIYKRAKGSKTWKELTTVYGDDQLYCYDDSIIAGKSYYYTVKSYVESDGVKKYSDYDKKGVKVCYKSVKVNAKKGDYSSGSVYGSNLSDKQLLQVKKAVDSFCKEYITSDMSQLEKIITAQLYMMSNCIYADDWGKNSANTAWGALVYKNSQGYHEAQCSGFARGFKALCDGMGIPCRYVHANSKSANPSHQWNEVKIGNKWYIVDPQCNATFSLFAYFLCGADTYKYMAGMAWDTKKYPKVSARDYEEKKVKEALGGYKIALVMKKCDLSFGE